MSDSKDTGEKQWNATKLARHRGQLFFSYGQRDKETETYVPLASARELRRAAEQAERAIDGHMKYLLVSGVAEEGGGLLCEASKGLAEARASIAAALATFPAEEEQDRGGQ